MPESGGTTPAFQGLAGGFVAGSSGIRTPMPTFSMRVYTKSLLIVVGHDGIVTDVQLAVRGER